MQNRIATVSLLALMSLGVAVAQQSTPELKHRQPPPSSTQSGSVSIPNGLDFQVELLDELDSSAAKIGDPFTAKLMQDLSANGVCIAQAGSLVKGRIADVTNSGRRFHGKNTLTLRPESIMTADGRQVTISAMMIDTFDRKSFKVDSEGSVSNTAGHYGTMSAIGAGVGTVGGWMVAGPVGAVAGSGIGAALPAGRWATKNDPVVLPANTKYWFETTGTTSATVPAPVTSAAVTLAPAPQPTPAPVNSTVGMPNNKSDTVMLTPAPMTAPSPAVAAKPSPTPTPKAAVSQPENEPSSGVMHPPEESDPE